MEPPMMNFARLSQRIDEIAQKWDTSGAVVVVADGHIVHKNRYGYADRDKGIRTSPNSTYLVSSRSPMLIGLCIMQLVDRNKVSLQDTLDRYVPEYQHASRITVRQLLYHNTGIPDYFYSGKMIELSRSGEHQGLSEQDRFRVERTAYEQPITLSEALAIIENTPLEFEPGTRDGSWSASNAVFLQAIIERVSGLGLSEYQREHIFAPLGMDHTMPGCHANTVSYGCIKETILVRLPIAQEMDHAFTTTVDDMVKLMWGVVGRQLLSRRAWKRATAYDSEGRAIIAEQANGVACAEGGILGYEFNLYFDQRTRLAYIHLTNETQTQKLVNDEWFWFRKEMRRAIEEETTYPQFTVLQPYSRKNAWEAMNLEVHESQKHFVLDAKASLGYALARPRVRKPYVLMEGSRSVGLLVLGIDKQKSVYDVDILLIDKRYQRRGFGKIILAEGLEILKQHGARRMEIGVNRFNIAAQRLYFSLGFQPVAVYEQGMWLRVDLNRSTGETDVKQAVERH
jgi:CubicO group peptidase (beta-lactamase class C family)/GNAT superfamily N-acetyltransferase